MDGKGLDRGKEVQAEAEGNVTDNDGAGPIAEKGPKNGTFLI